MNNDDDEDGIMTCYKSPYNEELACSMAFYLLQDSNAYECFIKYYSSPRFLCGIVYALHTALEHPVGESPRVIFLKRSPRSTISIRAYENSKA